jgi:hypothetical protein
MYFVFTDRFSGLTDRIAILRTLDVRKALICISFLLPFFLGGYVTWIGITIHNRNHFSGP